MAHFVLIHGAGHGAWCWYKLRCLMEASGHKVTCPDLASAGTDRTDANTIFTFDAYNKPIVDFLQNLPSDEKVILVGHSAGGLSITDAIHRFGCSKICMAIYVAANMLKLGFITDQDFKDSVPDLSEYGDVSEKEYALGPDKPPTSTALKREFLRQLLYHLSPMEDSTLASMLVRPAPAMAFSSARFSEGATADEVPRVYIKTLRDQILQPHQQQDAMISRWPPSQVLHVDSDHSPFFSDPATLFGYFDKLASSFK